MYEDAINFFPQLPPKLQTIGFPISGEADPDPTVSEANGILLAFLAKLEAFLNLKSSPLNYTLLWDQVKPDPALPPLEILLNRTYPTFISKEQTRNIRTPFYADYAAVHDGRLPFVDPVPRVSSHKAFPSMSGQFSALLTILLKVRWAFGDSLPASELDMAINNKTLFKDFWESYVLPAGRNDTEYCSDSLILYSSGVNILYRNTYLE